MVGCPPYARPQLGCPEIDRAYLICAIGRALWRRSATGPIKYSYNGGRPTGLGISGGAPIDRKGDRIDTRFQKSDDLAGAERRPLHARVSPPDVAYLHSLLCITVFGLALSAFDDYHSSSASL
jgi:hypothetical protein